MNLALVATLLVLNLWTFLVYGVDKRRARRGKERVPESTLLLLAAVGGALGAWLAVRIWRHKSNKTRFLLPLLIATVVAVLAWWTLIGLLWQPAETA